MLEAFIPNIFSVARIFASFWLYQLIITGRFGFAFLLLSFAVFTDFYDGYFARKHGVISKIGSFLDPLGDKLLVILSFYALYVQGILGGSFGLYVLAIVIGRELLVTILRTVLVAQKKELKTSFMGKSKAVLQFIVLFLHVGYLYGASVSFWGIKLWEYLTHVAIRKSSIAVMLVITVWSGLRYLAPFISRKITNSSLGKK